MKAYGLTLLSATLAVVFFLWALGSYNAAIGFGAFAVGMIVLFTIVALARRLFYKPLH